MPQQTVITRMCEATTNCHHEETQSVDVVISHRPAHSQNKEIATLALRAHSR